MTEERHPVLQRAVEAISDGDPVDWAAEMRMNPDLSPLLESVRDIESLMRVFREAAAATDLSERDAVAANGADTVPRPVLDSVSETLPVPGADARVGAEDRSGADAATLDHPTRWGRLERLRRIDGGGFGDVYRAYDPMLDREVALKLLRERTVGPDATVHALLSEARKLARVRHPNVLVVHGADCHDGRAGMWTDLLTGETLELRLERHGLFSAREATAVGIDLCRALGAVHAEGMMHRDIKTFNVMRTEKGQIVLMDFGSVGDLTTSGVLRTSTLRGTPLTMAPEHLRGDPINPTADLYSVGVLLYHLVTGAYPVEAENFAELGRKHVKGEIVPLVDRRPDLPRDFIAVVEKAMSQKAADRYPCAEAMERALLKTMEEPTPQVVPEPAPDPAGRPWWSLVRTQFVSALRALAGGPAGRTLAAIVFVMMVGLFSYQSFWRSAPDQNGRAAEEPRKFDPFPGASRGSGSGGTPIEPRSVTKPPAVASPIKPPVPVLAVEAHLYRETSNGNERLLPGARVAPGDALWLEIRGNRPVYVYVFNEDQAGEASSLFPSAASASKNPLESGVKHRLPGLVNGQRGSWRVSSAGGRETFVAIAATEPLQEVERLIGERTHAAVRLRGTGEVAPSMRSLQPVLDQLPNGGADPWVWRIELENPRP